MQGKRTDRIGELIREEIGRLLLRETRDPRLKNVNITDVEVSVDLSHARVYYSCLEDSHREEIEDALGRARGFFRSALGRRLSLRRVPDLRFQLDTTLRSAGRIEAILNALHEEEEPDSGGEEPDTGGEEE